MQLSIRDASRFVIGAGLMRQEAIAASGNPDITFEDVAQAALREGPVGQKIRDTIETLADQEAAWLRSTPPHILSSERVMQSRNAEVRAFTAIHTAVIDTISFDGADAPNKPDAERKLRESLVSVLGAIDGAPGSKADRENLMANLRDQLFSVAHDGDFIKKTLRESEQAYLAADLDKTFSRYTAPPLQRSADYDDDFTM